MSAVNEATLHHSDSNSFYGQSDAEQPRNTIYGPAHSQGRTSAPQPATGFNRGSRSGA